MDKTIQETENAAWRLIDFERRYSTTPFSAVAGTYALYLAQENLGVTDLGRLLKVGEVSGEVAAFMNERIGGHWDKYLPMVTTYSQEILAAALPIIVEREFQNAGKSLGSSSSQPIAELCAKILAFKSGASMVTVGSVAVTQPELFLSWVKHYGADRMILGADVRNGKISINGWKEDSSEDLLPFLRKYTDAGVTNVLCTEISKDGTLQGPAIELYRRIMAEYPTLHLIASGGVSSIDDIRALDAAGIPAVVFGKAIYEGRINLKELI